MSGPQFNRPQTTGVLLQAATDAKNSSQVYRCTLADLVCLAGENHWQRSERQLQLTAVMCVTRRWKFWTCNMTVGITDNYLLHLIKCHLMCLVFLRKIPEFCNKLNGILKISGVTLVKMIHFTQIFRYMDPKWCRRSNMFGQ